MQLHYPEFLVPLATEISLKPELLAQALPEPDHTKQMGLVVPLPAQAELNIHITALFPDRGVLKLAGK